MRDGAAERRLDGGPRRVDMNPLPVFGRLGEEVDAFLGDRQPIADRNLASDLTPQLL